MVKGSLIVALLYFLSPIAIAKIQAKVIYGDDSRLEFFQAPRAEVRTVADSTAAMIQRSHLTNNANGTTAISARTFQSAYGLCGSERFGAQPAGAFCSAFLVGPDLIATAGHCVNDETCADSTFVFGYRMSQANMTPMDVDSAEVYSCQRVVKREETSEQDYALVQLDREVRGHKVLALAQTPAQPGDSLVVVGHPSGLPTKISGGAQVRASYPGYFTANLDTYAGNSGSAVFNERTLEVVGILVRGETDFAFDRVNQCYVSNHCPADGCRGEDVTNISYIEGAIQTAMNR